MKYIGNKQGDEPRGTSNNKKGNKMKYEIKSYDTSASGNRYTMRHGIPVRNTSTVKVYEVYINGKFVDSFNLLRDAKKFASKETK